MKPCCEGVKSGSGAVDAAPVPVDTSARGRDAGIYHVDHGCEIVMIERGDDRPT
jgi:hypothetical protein